MSQDIDFIPPQIKTIEKPQKIDKKLKQQSVKKSGSKSFSIQKSFLANEESIIPQQIRPEVEQLKKFLKMKKDRQRRQKQRIASGNQKEQQIDGKQKVKQNTIQENYKVDESGHLRDSQGNLIFVKNQATQLIINKKKEQQHQSKQISKKPQIKYHQKLSKVFLDRNLVVSGSKKRIRRSMMGLQFLQKGSYQPYSSSKLKEQIKNIDQITKKDTESEPRILKKRIKTNLQFQSQIPKCQWWDLQIIKESDYLQLIDKEQNQKKEINFQSCLKVQNLNNQITFQKVGNPEKKTQKINIPLYLTKEQRKKLKRKRKKEKLVEKNDMIKLGLLQPEKPKLKISNMAIVMKDQFIIDPSKVEALAAKQQQQRLNQHLKSNSQRKLTKSQKKQKSLKKLKKDSAKQCRRIVFKLNKLSDPSQIFKVNMNAKQLALNGFILQPSQYHSQPVIIMAQGGQKAIRFFKNLMINRIKWNENDENECHIIWEGEIKNSKLGKWTKIEVNDESETIRTLTQKGVENFRDYMF